MVQIIPRTRPTFGERVGGGIEKGVDTATQFAKMSMESGLAQKSKQQALQQKLAGYNEFKKSTAYQDLTDTQKLVLDLEAREAITGGTGKSILNFEREQMGQKAVGDALKGFSSMEEDVEPGANNEMSGVSPQEIPKQTESPKIKKTKGQSLDEQLKFWQSQLSSPFENMQNTAKSKIDEINRKQQMNFQQKTAYTKLNEPRLETLNTKIQNNEENGLRFERINTLLNEEGGSFPSSFTAAMFDLEGEGGLSKIGRSQLSETTQEFVKLVIDMMNGAQGTYGGKVSNFEAAQYLKRLPGLLNSPGGKARVVRDLQILNKLNLIHDQAILNEFDKVGGSGDIPYSEAENRARKAIKSQTDELKAEFINPKKKTFSSMPDPSLHKGKKLQDETTGDIFTSDGLEWKRNERT